MVRYFIFCALLLPRVAVGQAWVFSSPEKLPVNVNSEYEEGMPLLSPDGRTMYFTRFLSPENVGGKFTGADIWVSQYDVTTFQWGRARNQEALNNRGNNVVTGISSNGQTLYFLNTTSTRRVSGVYFSRKLNNGWSRPEFISIPGIEPESFLGMFVSPDFDVVFLSMKGPDSRGEEDLYISTKTGSGEWTVPRNLGPTVNTTGFEISPFLSADKKRLYFSSNGHKGLGDADIFYTDRLYNSWETWSVPRNLGDKLNSKNFDAFFSMYGDTIAYFASNRNSERSDIYRVKVVPGEETLPFGFRYLSVDETNKIIGASVSRKIVFENATTELTAAQRELLFFIANKVFQDKTINLQVTVMEENNPSLTKARLSIVADQLKLAGIEATRILTQDSKKNKRESKRATTLEIILFK
jgi:hypothetical protein